MKNTFLKQNLFVLAAVALSWIIGSWLFSDKYSDLWALTLSLLVFYAPLVYLRYNNSIKNSPDKNLNKAIKVVLWVSILLALIPLIEIINYNFFFLPLIAPTYNPDSIYGNGIVINLLSDIWGNIFYFISALLIYFALKSDKDESPIKQSV